MYKFYRLHGSTAFLETPNVFVTGCQDVHCFIQRSSHDGRASLRLGCNPQGQNGQRGVGTPLMFCSHKLHGTPCSVPSINVLDTLAHKWPRVILEAFPPLALISPTFSQSAGEGSLSLILIAPHWTEKHWLVEITQLLWPFPLRQQCSPRRAGRFPQPEWLALWAWPVNDST